MWPSPLGSWLCLLLSQSRWNVSRTLGCSSLQLCDDRGHQSGTSCALRQSRKQLTHLLAFQKRPPGRSINGKDSHNKKKKQEKRNKVLITLGQKLIFYRLVYRFYGSVYFSFLKCSSSSILGAGRKWALWLTEMKEM